MSPECVSCGGTGWRIDEANGLSQAVRCECYLHRQTEHRLATANIPSRYADCTLESYAPVHSSQRRAKAIATRFCDEFPLTERGLLFLGPCGVGKTHLAIAILRTLTAEKGIRSRFYDFRELLRQIRDSYNPVSSTTELAILRPIFETEFIVLDDLGASKPTDWVKETLSHIINQRYSQKKTTILTSNYLDRDFTEAHPDETLQERIGTRLRSRLYEMCLIVEIEGEDFRRENRQAAYQFETST